MPRKRDAFETFRSTLVDARNQTRLTLHQLLLRTRTHSWLGEAAFLHQLSRRELKFSLQKRGIRRVAGIAEAMCKIKNKSKDGKK